jgi:predicted nucleic acid-binding protein
VTCVIVNDASCLIDLRKGRLLAVLCNLPYGFVIPLPVRESEVLDVSDEQWRQLDAAGMVTHDLSPEEIAQALALKKRHPALSANDCFCLVTALAYPGILLTGDALLRRIASASGLRVHGVLWIIDQLDATAGCARSRLIQALRIWQGDDAVFLPKDEVSKRLKRLATKS